MWPCQGLLGAGPPDQGPVLFCFALREAVRLGASLWGPLWGLLGPPCGSEVPGSGSPCGVPVGASLVPTLGPLRRLFEAYLPPRLFGASSAPLRGRKASKVWRPGHSGMCEGSRMPVTRAFVPPRSCNTKWARHVRNRLRKHSRRASLRMSFHFVLFLLPRMLPPVLFCCWCENGLPRSLSTKHTSCNVSRDHELPICRIRLRATFSLLVRGNLIPCNPCDPTSPDLGHQDASA